MFDWVLNTLLISAVAHLLTYSGYKQEYTHQMKSLISFSWYLFSCIQTEYEDLFCKSQYSLRMLENTDLKNFK